MAEYCLLDAIWHRHRARRKMRWAVRALLPSQGEPRYRQKLKAAIRAQRQAVHDLGELVAHPPLS